MSCEASASVGTDSDANELASVFQFLHIGGNAHDDGGKSGVDLKASECVDIGNYLKTTPALWLDVVADDHGNEIRDHVLEPKHKIFLSHSGAQKSFVADLCSDLIRRDRYPFFDRRRSSLPVGYKFPNLIFDAIKHCHVGVVVLSEEFFTRSKWPMLELVAMVEESKKSNPRMKIIPVFYSISRNTCRDATVHAKWMHECWKKWGEEDKKRIDVWKWKSALGVFGSTTGLEMKDGMLDGELRAEIVEAICKEVPPAMRWNDSKVEGKTRLCQEILKKVYKGEQAKDLKGGVQKVGLYGMGGIGKTTACKILCNEVSVDYCDRVCHVELGSLSELELLRKALGAFSDLDIEILGKISDVEVGHGYLKTHIVKERVFLALDNVSDESRDVAKSYLEANFGDGSVVVITARSMDQLQCLGIKKEDCFTMPELELEEAKRLFLSYAGLGKNEVDEVFVEKCVKRCYFCKGQSSSSRVDEYHYHPLALKVLGGEVGPEISLHGVTRQVTLLKRINTFNLSRQEKHPVFSILRSSYDSLKEEDQLLFLLVAWDLWNPYWCFCGPLKWLGMVDGEKDSESIEWRLEVLKRKSLLLSYGKYLSDFSMHDLWREFAGDEMESGRFKDRYLFEKVEGCNGKVDLTGFPLMRAVRLVVNNVSGLELNVCGLKQLKILDVFCGGFVWDMKGLGTLESLTYFSCNSVASNACISELGLLTNLQVVELNGFAGDTLPDMSKLTNLRYLSLTYGKSLQSINLQNLTNLGKLYVLFCDSLQSINLQNLTNLVELGVKYCESLQSINLRNLTNLVELYVVYCNSLQSLDTSGCRLLPSLSGVWKRKCLRKLNITGCSSVHEMEGLGDLVALEELRAMHCDRLAVLPRCRLPNLRVLEIEPEKVPAGFEWKFGVKPIRIFRRMACLS